MRTVIPLFLVVFGLAACGEDPKAACMDHLDEECSPLYPPSFDEVHSRTLMPSCAQAGCHDATTRESGLDLSTADSAHAALQPMVSPGEPECSTLMMRIEGHRLDVMPPGAKMSDAERCAIQQWIEEGAER